MKNSSDYLIQHVICFSDFKDLLQIYSIHYVFEPTADTGNFQYFWTVQKRKPKFHQNYKLLLICRRNQLLCSLFPFTQPSSWEEGTLPLC